MRSIVACVATMLLVHGCMTPIDYDFSTGNARIADPRVVAQVQEGMTKSEVERIIGKPMVVDFTDAGFEKWIYSYAKVSGAFSPKSRSHTLTVLFNEEGLVKRVGKGEKIGE